MCTLCVSCLAVTPQTAACEAKLDKISIECEQSEDISQETNGIYCVSMFVLFTNHYNTEMNRSKMYITDRSTQDSEAQAAVNGLLESEGNAEGDILTTAIRTSLFSEHHTGENCRHLLLCMSGQT